SSLSLSYKNEDLTLVHGTLDNPQDFDYMTNGFVAEATFRILETVICFVGHTHIAGFFIKDKNGKLYYSKDYIMEINSDKKYIVNVGSVGQPRDRDTRASYCIYDTDEKKVYLNRIDYDIEAVQKKIERAHLPRFLSERLSLGR
ncbi:MAG: metallophosphoesterase family protein, partial [Candidatus Omnitrophota bacterium]